MVDRTVGARENGKGKTTNGEIRLSRRKKLLFIAVILFLCLLALEAGVRIGLPDLMSTEQKIGYGYKPELFTPLEGPIIYGYTPGYRGHFTGRDYRHIEISINSLGYREREFMHAKPDGVWRAISIGDSIAVGAGVKYEEIYAKHLESVFNAEFKTECEFVNAGVNSYNIEQYFENLKRLVTGPDTCPEAVVMGICLNDYDESPDNPLHIGDKPKLTASKKIKKILKKSALVMWCVKYILHARDKPPETPEEYQRRYVGEMVRRIEGGRAEKGGEVLDAIIGFTRERRIPLVVAIFPARSQIDGTWTYDVQRFYSEPLASAGVPYIDFLDEFKKHDPQVMFLEGDYFHFTPAGHRLIAERLAELMKREGIAPAE